MPFSIPFLCPRRLYSYPCVSIGAVFDGKPVSPILRRIIYFRLKDASIQAGDDSGVRAGGGKVVDAEWLGRITVPLEGNLELIQLWIREIFQESGENTSEDEIYDGIKRRIVGLGSGAGNDGNDYITLDIFKGKIMSPMKDTVFAYRKPTSF